MNRLGVAMLFGALTLHLSGIVHADVGQDTNPGGGKYQCGAADDAAAAQASRTIANALGRLDAGVVQEVGLEYLLLCGGMFDSWTSDL